MDKDPIRRSGLRKDFWKRFALDELRPGEWEALCDGCGKCCLVKLEDEDGGAVAYTRVACRLLDLKTCRCGSYALRQQLVAGCVTLRPENLDEVLEWMPSSCAYRRLHEGRGLADWHPLISGDPDSVAGAGFSIPPDTVPEYDTDEEDWPDFIVGDDV